METLEIQKGNRGLNRSITKLYGAPAALVLEYLQYWIKQNYKKSKNYHNQYTWMYNSTKKMANEIDCYSERTIARAIKKLEKAQIIQINNFNKFGYDRTQWFSIINTEVIEIYNLPEKKQRKKASVTPITTHVDKVANPLGQHDKLIRTNWQNNTSYKTIIKTKEGFMPENPITLNQTQMSEAINIATQNLNKRFNI